jgi:predicted esterase
MLPSWRLHYSSALKNYVLIGFSGGAAIALLVAAREMDRVLDIRTIAGYLDTRIFTKVHSTKPLVHSVDPARVAVQVARITQLHYVGTTDRQV